MINSGFVLLQLLGVFLYYSIKQKKLANPIDSILGIGDILILVLLGLLFSPVNYILFLLVSLLVTLAVFLIQAKLKFKKQVRQIPLAGFLGIYINILLLVQLANSNINYYDTMYLENLILKLL